MFCSLYPFRLYNHRRKQQVAARRQTRTMTYKRKGLRRIFHVRRITVEQKTHVFVPASHKSAQGDFKNAARGYIQYPLSL